MPVSYILSQAGKKMGLNPADATQRLVLLGYLNEAANELYPQADFPGSLVEQYFKINGDQTISLPWYVGHIRGMREAENGEPWHINRLRPRYNQYNWIDCWRNYRLKGKQALMASVINESVGVITVHAVETPNIVVTVSGPSDNAAHINEEVTMDAVSKLTTNRFLDYVAVKKDRVNNYDITLSDVDGRLLTVIPNNCKEAQYQIVDVSECPWLPSSTSVTENYIEVLYKKALPYLSDDADEFPAFDFDNILVNKMMQLAAEEEEKPDIAIVYDGKATRSAARVVEDHNRATEDVVSLVEHPHDTLLPRNR